MNLTFSRLIDRGFYRGLADIPLPDPKTLDSPPTTPQTDPLIDQGGANITYVGVFLLIVGIAIVVGAFSRKVEHAVITALVLSIFPIAFFILAKP
jgi:hypothetical protein